MVTRQTPIEEARPIPYTMVPKYVKSYGETNIDDNTALKISSFFKKKSFHSFFGNGTIERK